MDVQFPITDYEDPETLAEMVSRVLGLYGAELRIGRLKATSDSANSRSPEGSVQNPRGKNQKDA